MKRYVKTMLGVTLLEIMLVLAIAAMIIVMSIRYYQSASISQQANSTLEQIQSITAGMDNLAQGTGSYSSITTSTLTAVVGGANNLLTAWGGGSITIKTAAQGSYSMSIPSVPPGVCASLLARLKTNTKFGLPASSTCASAATFSYTYTAAN